MREEILDDELIAMKPVKLYSQRSIVIATFIMGPIATGILLRRNFKNINEPKKAINALSLGILSMVLLIVVLAFLPDSTLDSIPRVIIPLTYTFIAQFIVEKQMGERLRIHKNNNGDFYPIWKFILITIGIVVGLGTIAFIIGDFMAVM